jgi:hypothetical protein
MIKYTTHWGVRLLALAFLTTGCLPTDSSNSTTSNTNEAPASAFFLEVTTAAGLGDFRHAHGGFGDKWFPEIMGSGGGFLDYDGDGWLDIMLVRGGSLPSRSQDDIPAVSLYRNDGDGTYTNVTDEAGLGGVRAYGFGSIAADYDNDGDQDILLTTLRRNLLFRNEGGVFEEVSQEAGIADVEQWSASAVFFDANRDGHLDLYVTNYVEWSPEQVLECINRGVRDYCNPRSYNGVADTYYQSNGDGTFTNRTEAAGFLEGVDQTESKGLGVIELDFNNDGWPDLYVANDGVPNLLFQNNGDGTFREIAFRSGVALDQRGTPRAGMGIDVGVVDSTEEPTIFVGNFSQESVSVWRHQREGLFIDRVTVSGLRYPTMKTLTFGLILFDVDLDTDLDLLLANGNVIEQIAWLQEGITFRQPPQLFLNRGNGVFDDASSQLGPAADSMLARGLAYGDVDRDGDPDVVFTENNGPAHLWYNNSKERHFLRVHLQGTESNRDGIGARLRATVNGLTMERRVRAGSSYLSQSEKTVTFGLGERRDVDGLEVIWPSGRVEQFEQVAPDQEVLLVEGTGELAPVDAGGLATAEQASP